jgi:hypothetical protein
MKQLVEKLLMCRCMTASPEVSCHGSRQDASTRCTAFRVSVLDDEFTLAMATQQKVQDENDGTEGRDDLACHAVTAIPDSKPRHTGALMETALFEDPDTLSLRSARKHVPEHQRDPSDDDSPGLTLFQTLGARAVRAVPRPIERVHAWNLELEAGRNNQNPAARGHLGHAQAETVGAESIHVMQVELEQVRAEIVALQTREQKLMRMVSLRLDRNQDLEARDEVRLRWLEDPHPLTSQGDCWTKPKKTGMGKQVGQPEEDSEGGGEAGQQAGQTLREEESQGALHKAVQQGRGALPTAVSITMAHAAEERDEVEAMLARRHHERASVHDKYRQRLARGSPGQAESERRTGEGAAAATFPASPTYSSSSSSSSSASSLSTTTTTKSAATFSHPLLSPLPVAISSSAAASASSAVLSPMMAVLQGATIVRESCASGGRTSRQNLFVKSNEVPNTQGKSSTMTPRRQIKAQHLLPPNPPSAQDQALMESNSFLMARGIERLMSTAEGEANSVKADLVVLVDLGGCGSQVQAVSEELVQGDRRELGMLLAARAGPFGGKLRSILKSRNQSSESAFRRM